MLTALALIAFFALHQDIWFWRSAQPLVFGVLPVGLAWHAGYTLAVSVVMAILVRRAWPAHLEDAAGEAADEPSTVAGRGPA